MFLLPIEIENPTRGHRRYVVWAFIAINTGIYVFSFWHRELNQLLGFVPANPTLTSALASMFLHGGIWHLAGNMFFLWMFGDNVEDATQGWLFAVCYFACGIAATGAYAILHRDSLIPLVGASGAISGVVAMYLLFFPKVRFSLLVIVPYAPRLPHIDMHTLGAVGSWFGEQALLAVLAETGRLGPNVNVAFSAHVGGFGAGLIIGLSLLSLGWVKRLRPENTCRSAGDATDRVSPDAPSLLSPMNGYAPGVRKSNITLKWCPVIHCSGIRTYNYQLSTSAEFQESCIHHSGSVRRALVSLSSIEPTTWYWRVQAVSHSGAISAWSTPSAFTLRANDAPDTASGD